MLPIPAIDIQSGKCVRLKMGNLDSAKIYYENPLEAAEFWIEKGTKRLHIVDLDGALKGASVNFSVILEIRNSFPDIEIQLGGGIRSFETVESYVKNKIDFLCNAGFMRIHGEKFVEKWFNKHLNIHPALLPSFKGLNTHERAIKSGVKFAGCTVHLVRSGVDEGPIIGQAVTSVDAHDDKDLSLIHI